MTTIESLYSDAIRHYHNGKYSEAAEALRVIMMESSSEEALFLSVDLGHLLCLLGEYDSSAKILAISVEELETRGGPKAALANAYLSYAISLLNLNEYGKYCLNVSKYLNIIKDFNPTEYDYLINIV